MVGVGRSADGRPARDLDCIEPTEGQVGCVKE